MKIESGAGNAKEAAVDKHLRLEVQSESASIEHTISKRDGQAYQINGTATVANTTVVIGHVKNTSSTRAMIINHINWQVLDISGGSAIPNANNFLCIQHGRSFSTGGSAITPVNLKVGSGNAADVIAYDSNPTLTGTATQIDRWYPKASGDHMEFEAYQTGTMIVDPGKEIEFSYVSDHLGGTVFVSLGFTMEDIDLRN